MDEMRRYRIVIGSKQYFDNYVASEFNDVSLDISSSFSYMIRLNDDARNKNRGYYVDFEKSEFLLVKNDNYHGIVEQAHDRLGPLIEELTTEDAIIVVHNPTITLEDYLRGQHLRGLIKLSDECEKHQMMRDKQVFKTCIDKISEKIIGQNNALREVTKSMWYLTCIERKKPFVIMLYGNSSIGKTEMVRQVASQFFDDKVTEKHLSMYKTGAYAYELFGDKPNRRSIGFELLERESNLVFLDEFDKLPNDFFSVFYTLFDNVMFKDSTYRVDISGLLIFLTSNYSSENEMKKHLGLPIYYRIDKFIRFDDFSADTIHKVTEKEILHCANNSDGQINADVLYNRVSSKLNAQGENARTIKNAVQREVEDLLFEEIAAIEHERDVLIQSPQ